MKIFITGSGGYLGNVLTRQLIQNGFTDLKHIDLGIFNVNYNGYTKDNLLTADLNDYLYGVDVVIHLASISNDPACEIDTTYTQLHNVHATRRLVNFCNTNKIKRFIFASSASVYGCNDAFATETSELNPQSAYAESKIIGEQYINAFPELSPVILRFATLYGRSPKMRYDLVLNNMVKDAVVNRKIKVMGGEQYRPFLSVADAARAIIHAIGHGKSDTINIAKYNTTISSLAEKVASIIPVEIESAGESKDVRNYKMDTTKMERSFVFEPKYSFESEIESMLQGTFIESKSNYTIQAWKERIYNDTILQT